MLSFIFSSLYLFNVYKHFENPSDFLSRVARSVTSAQSGNIFPPVPTQQNFAYTRKKKSLRILPRKKKSQQKCKQSEYTKKHPIHYRWVIAFCLYAFRGILSANNQILNLLFVCVILLPRGIVAQLIYDVNFVSGHFAPLTGHFPSPPIAKLFPECYPYLIKNRPVCK